LKRNDDKLVIFVSPVNETLIDTYSSKEYAARCHVEFSRAHQSLLWYLDSQGIPYIDGSNQFEAEDFVDLVHVNVNGERRIAELIDGYVSGGRPISASARQQLNNRNAGAVTQRSTRPPGF